MCLLDNVQYMCARDVIMHVNGKNNKQASQVWDRLPEDKLEEVSSCRRNFKFPGQGQSEQPVLTFQGILKLVMWIGGENAKKYRTAMVKILTRYYAGDDSLTDEIEANAKSSSPIAQMARASLAAEQVEERSLVELKRKREELENSKMEVDIEAKRIANHAAESEIELKKRAAEVEIELKKHAAEAVIERENRVVEVEVESKKIANRAAEAEIELKNRAAEAEIKLKSRAVDVEIESTSKAIRAADLANKASEHGLIAKVSNSYHELCQNVVMDERARLIFKDSFLNMAMLQGPSAANANGEQANKPVSLSMIATELGMKFSTDELKSIGKILSKRYFTKHGKAPTKHEQLVNGMVLKICSYTESDRPLIEEVLRLYRDSKK